MAFTVDFSVEFLKWWKQFQQPQKDRVTEFIALVKMHGLDQTKLPGKLSPSWMGASQADFAYAKQHSLWHYHVGYPIYRTNPHGPKTSDWLLHFQWVQGNTHIHVVDLYQHYTYAGNFYLPRVAAANSAPTTAPSPPGSTPDEHQP